MFNLTNFVPEHLINKRCKRLSVEEINSYYSISQADEALKFFCCEKPTAGQRWKIKTINGKPTLRGTFFFQDYEKTFAFVSVIYILATQENYYPEDITFGDGFTYISLCNNKQNGISENEFIMLAKIDDDYSSKFE